MVVLGVERGAGWRYFSGEGHATGDEDAAGGVVSGHHAELAFLDEGDEVFDLFVQGRLVEVCSLIRVHGFRGLICVGAHGDFVLQRQLLLSNARLKVERFQEQSSMK